MDISHELENLCNSEINILLPYNKGFGIDSQF